MQKSKLFPSRGARFGFSSLSALATGSKIVRYITVAGLPGQEMNIEYPARRRGTFGIQQGMLKWAGELRVVNRAFEYGFLIIIGLLGGHRENESRQVFARHLERP